MPRKKGNTNKKKVEEPKVEEEENKTEEVPKVEEEEPKESEVPETNDENVNLLDIDGEELPTPNTDDDLARQLVAEEEEAKKVEALQQQANNYTNGVNLAEMNIPNDLDNIDVGIDNSTETNENPQEPKPPMQPPRRLVKRMKSDMHDDTEMPLRLWIIKYSPQPKTLEKLKTILSVKSLETRYLKKDLDKQYNELLD